MEMLENVQFECTLDRCIGDCSIGVTALLEHLDVD